VIAPKALEELGRAREGSLSENPFPVLLQALFFAERTATIELKQRQFIKRIALEDGVPVDCESNLLHETPGRFLVEKGKLDEAGYQKALTESVLAGERIEQTLLRLKLVEPFELFKLLQQNLAYKVLDCFCATWSGAHFRVLPEPPEVKQPLRLNLAQLVFTGASTFSPFAEVEEHTRELCGSLALVSEPAHAMGALKLASKDARLMQELKKRPSLEVLIARLQCEPEDLLRKLYALHVLGYIALAAEVKEPDATRQPNPSPPDGEGQGVGAVAPAAPPSLDVEKVRNDVTAAYLSHRAQDALALLDLSETATAAQVRERFLAWSERFAPWRFAAGELAPLQEKARDLFLAGARAYAQLSDPEQRGLVLKRRAAAREASARKRSTDFSIKTDMLDGPRQFEDGMKRLASGDYRAAVDLLEFASACDPRKMEYRVHLAHARFLAEPRANERTALAELDEVLRIDPGCGEALLVSGEIHTATGRFEKADECFRRASKLLPGDRRPVEKMRQVAAELSKAKRA